MVISLKTALCHVQDEKGFQQEMNNHLPVAVFVKNSDDGKYIFWNTTSEKMFERVAADVIGKTAREVYSESKACIVEAEAHAALTGRIHKYNKFPASMVMNVSFMP